MNSLLPKRLLLALACALAPAAWAGEPAAAAAPVPVRVTIAGHRARAWASSTLASKSGRYTVDKLFDGNPATAWAEGVEGAGDRSTITVEFDEPVTVTAFILRPGLQASPALFAANLAPRVAVLEADGVQVGVADFHYRLSTAGARCVFEAHAANLAPHVFVLHEPRTARSWSMRLDAWKVLVAQYQDMAFSEWTFLLDGAPLPPGTSPGVSAALAFLEKVAATERIDPADVADDARTVSPRTPALDILRLTLEGSDAVLEILRQRGVEVGKSGLANLFPAGSVRQCLGGSAVTVVQGPGAAVTLYGGISFWHRDFPRAISGVPALRLAQRPGGWKIVESGLQLWLEGECTGPDECTTTCDDELQGLDRPL